VRNFRNHLFLFIFITVFSNFSIAQNSDKIESLETLLEEGLTNNPQLQSFSSKFRADEARIPQAGALPDPMVSLNMLNLPIGTLVFDQEPMTGKQIAVKQTFPFWGKLDIKESIAKKGAQVSKANLEELSIQLVRNIKSTYYDIYYLDRALETTTINRDLFREFVKIAEQKYAVGSGLQQDVLKAQVELSKLEDRLIQLRQKRSTLEARVNTLLNRPTERPFGETVALGYKPLLLDRKAIKSALETNRPLLRAWRTRIGQSADRIALAHKNYGPDMSVFAAYTQRDLLSNGAGGANFISGGITFSVPLYFWRKQNKQVQESELRKNSVEENYQRIQNQVFFELDRVLSDIDKNKQRLNLYKTGIVPQAAQSLNSALIGYQTDKIDFLTLVNNQLTLFNLELDYDKILSSYHKNIAELEYIAGGQIPE